MENKNWVKVLSQGPETHLDVFRLDQAKSEITSLRSDHQGKVQNCGC